MKRYEVIQFLIDQYQLDSYLEIGVQNGETFSHINIDEKLGVDPNSKYKEGVVQLTSDAFFQKNSKKFDIIFVDGDHDEQQAFADIKNSLDSLNPKGFVVVHDTLPHNLEYTDHQWCGTVFRAIQQINQEPNVSLVTVDDDHGVSILTKESSPPGQMYKDFFDFFDNRVECLNLISPMNLDELKFFGK